MTCYVASTSEIKLSATRAALETLEWGGSSVKGLCVFPSGVPTQPIGFAEIKNGAYSRLDYLEDHLSEYGAKRAAFLVSMENGLVVMDGEHFDVACVVVKDMETGRVSKTYSQMVPIPGTHFNFGPEKNRTIGDILLENNLVTNPQDPHAMLSGVSRRDILKQAVATVFGVLFHRRLQLDVIKDSMPVVKFKGIERFMDVGGLLERPILLQCAIAELHRKVPVFDTIAAIDARGFVIGSALGVLSGVPVVMLRKVGRLPGKVVTSGDYSTEYEDRDGLCVVEEQLGKAQRVLVVDDVVATGGTFRAAVELCNKLKKTVVACAAIVDLVAFRERAVAFQEQATVERPVPIIAVISC